MNEDSVEAPLNSPGSPDSSVTSSLKAKSALSLLKEANKNKSFIKGFVTNGGFLLLRETRMGNVDKVVDLLCRGVPFTSDSAGVSPLHFAAYNNSVEITELLLNGGILRDLKNKVDRTSLHIAAHMNHVGVLKLLLTYGADPNVKDMMKMTPLHWACEFGNVECVRYLLKYGAKVGEEDSFGRTVFDLAKNSEIAELLKMGSCEQLLEDQQSEKISDEKADMDISENTEEYSDDASSKVTQDGSPNVDKASPLESDLLPNINPLPRLISSDKDPMELLKEHGIQMLEPDKFTTVRSAVESGQKVVLTEAGKLALDSAFKKDARVSSPVKTSANESIIVVQNGKKCIKIHKSQLTKFQLEHDRSFLRSVGPSPSSSHRYFKGKYYCEDEEEELQLLLQSSINKLRSEAKLLDIFSKRKFRQANLYQQQLLSLIKFKDKPDKIERKSTDAMLVENKSSESISTENIPSEMLQN